MQLSILDGSATVRVAAASGCRRLPLKLPLGERTPAHATAAGKVLLAFASDSLPPDLADELPPSTPHTVTDPLVLQRQLAESRRMRVAIDRDELAVGLTSVASPVLGPDGALLGAISITGLSEDFDAAALGDAVRSAALKLHRRLSALAESN